MNRRDFFSAIATAPLLTSTLSSGALFAASFRIKQFEFAEATIPELQAALKSGKETAVSLAKKYLERIEEIDRKGPALNSMIEVNPEALAIARALDRERKAKGVRGPLHGVPIVLKDNIDTHDRMMTTAGSLALLGSLAPRDSFVAEKLRAAGAVILGKTNLSEWANFRSSRSTSGWRGVGRRRIPTCCGAIRRGRVPVRAPPFRRIFAPQRSALRPTGPLFRHRHSAVSSA
jgi:amidase